jgi:hypothetical protein
VQFFQSADESEDESHTGCARTNLPLPLVPRKLSRTTTVLPTPSLLPEDIFNDSLLVNPPGIEFQIMLAESRQRDFPESTINLRDLE